MQGKNLLLRMQMMYVIRDKIVPASPLAAAALIIPQIGGNYPTDWWNEMHDRDFLRGKLTNFQNKEFQNMGINNTT